MEIWVFFQRILYERRHDAASGTTVCHGNRRCGSSAITLVMAAGCRPGLPVEINQARAVTSVGSPELFVRSNPIIRDQMRRQMPARAASKSDPREPHPPHHHAFFVRRAVERATDVVVGGGKKL